MGTFAYPVEVGNFEGTRFEAIVAIVDTGATYTAIPSDLLTRIGVTLDEQKPFILASGENVVYGMSWIRMRLGGREQPTIAVYGPPGSDTLLGAFTLEGFGLGVDSVNKRLVPTPAFLVGLRAAPL